MSKHFKNLTVLKILDYYKDLWALSYVSSVAHWDLETYMPQKGVVARGEALGRLSTIRQKMFLDKNFVALIHKAQNEKNLNDYESAIVRVLLRSLDFYEKIPSNFLEKFENLTNTATVIWRKAKEENSFEVFEKPLSDIFKMNKEMAEYLGYKDSAYDALLDLFEEDLTSKEVTNFFDEIKSPLSELLEGIVSSRNYLKAHKLESTKYDRLKMEALNQKVLKHFWNEMDRFRIDVSSHPFTTSFGNNDTRITTWYHQTDFSRSLLATIHEFGHALYDLQSQNELEMTPIAGGSSLVIHESQSRFWENFIGRNDDFIKKFLSDFESVVGKKLSLEDVSLYFNKVSPSLLRVEADEVTYHFHIMLRYEIEKGIIEGKIKVKDLPEIWNEKMNEYLGVSPKKDSEGVLQDIHWSGGSVGYFPTYSLGTFLGAQWESKIKDLGLKGNDYSGTKSFLEKNIHKFGSTYTLKDLLKKNKMTFDPKVNIKYLQEKYRKLYKL